MDQAVDLFNACDRKYKRDGKKKSISSLTIIYLASFFLNAFVNKGFKSLPFVTISGMFPVAYTLVDKA